MLGDSSLENPTPGVFPLAIEDLFEMLSDRPDRDSMSVVVSFYEIYCGKLYDLLNNRRHLHARENAQGNVIIQGIREVEATSSQDLMNQIQVGLNSRTTGVTGANVDSSRSHAIIQISVKSRAPTGRMISNGARLSFIDLAGSERGADTVDQDKQTRLDGAEINKSLLALKECIRALDQQLDHTPFRGSKLTQVLKDSFIGQNCMTVMIANISPSSGSVEHTLNTLRYAYRVRELRGSGPTKRQIIPSEEAIPRRIPSQSRRPKAQPENTSSSSSSSIISVDENNNEVQGISLSPVNGGHKRPTTPSKPPEMNLDKLAKEHDRLIGTILSEEEELITTHRKTLEVLVQMMNEEMAQVDLIDQPGSDVDVYVSYMDENLKQKETMINSLRSKLDKFKKHLIEEERLSRLFENH
jgi:kinesin family protein 2/24